MKLKFELVNGCGVLVENRLIVDGKKYIDSINKAIHTWDMGSGIHEGKSTWCDVIIFAEKELGLDVPVFEWRDFEPNEKSLLSMFYNVCKATYPEFDEWIEAKEYKKWLEKSNPAKYTEDEVVEFVMSVISQYEFGNKNIHNRELITESLKSIQKYPKYVVMESEYDCCKRYVNCKGCDATSEMINYRLKLLTNSDGKQQGIVKEILWT
jgi:hypothetical protein